MYNFARSLFVRDKKKRPIRRPQVSPKIYHATVPETHLSGFASHVSASRYARSRHLPRNVYLIPDLHRCSTAFGRFGATCIGSAGVRRSACSPTHPLFKTWRF